MLYKTFTLYLLYMYYSYAGKKKTKGSRAPKPAPTPHQVTPKDCKDVPLFLRAIDPNCDTKPSDKYRPPAPEVANKIQQTLGGGTPKGGCDQSKLTTNPASGCRNCCPGDFTCEGAKAGCEAGHGAQAGLTASFCPSEVTKYIPCTTMWAGVVIGVVGILLLSRR
jgi:hypothetical protein